MVKNFISEDDIEKDLLQQLQTRHQYQILNCYTVNPDDLNDGSNRTDKRDVVLRDRLHQACQRLNPDIPEKVITEVVEVIAQRRTAMNDIKANREVYSFIRDGVSVEYQNQQGKKQTAIVRPIDFNNPDNNQYLAVSQLWIKTTSRIPKAQYRRPDVLLYINGIPLVFIELKNATVKLRTAYDENLKDYQNDIPQLFHYNGFCILSNALETKVGSSSASWDYFFNWFRIADEKEPVDRQQISASLTSLEYAIDGLAAPQRLLDYLENFIFFQDKNGIETKIIAQNHQFLGVNNAYQKFLERDKYEGKLGVFWHTQGSGKSFSMIFYARKIFRKITGNFTFVVVTDRQDLDRQIYQNLLSASVISENDAACPKDAAELRQYLSQNKKIIFTLIHKFRYDKGKTYPRLFDPSTTQREMIVIVDEAHRSQYEDLADNMRKGLEGAHFIAFTGTPLLGKDRKTNKWFGDYVSEYNFQQAMADNATVPLFYQKRVPQVLMQNDDLNEEFYDLLEDENLDESHQETLERQFAQELEIIKRPDRLETIAKDIVDHFPRRGYLGKGMVVCVDKFTAVTLYEKVQHHWKAELKTLRGRIHNSQDELEKLRLKRRLEYMKSVEMAVVISDPSTDKEKFDKQGLNICSDPKS